MISERTRKILRKFLIVFSLIFSLIYGVILTLTLLIPAPSPPFPLILHPIVLALLYFAFFVVILILLSCKLQKPVLLVVGLAPSSYVTVACLGLGGPIFFFRPEGLFWLYPNWLMAVYIAGENPGIIRKIIERAIPIINALSAIYSFLRGK